MREVSRDGSNSEIVSMPERPATSPSQVGATPWPSAVSMPIPVTTTRRVTSAHQLPGADRRGAIDVTGQATGGDRVGDRQRVELGPPDLGSDLVVLDVDERP